MNAPIGIFDSGIGGISLLREMDSLLPFEDFVYYGDTARMPYGVRGEKPILKYANEIISFLANEKKCKMIVVACNTVSGLMPECSQKNGVPVVGIINYGCVAAALFVTYNFRIGVLATKRTIRSGVYRSVMDGFDPTIKVYEQECTDLIPMVEHGMIGSPDTRTAAERYLIPLLRKNIDTLILGCTHLPFVRRIIQDITGPAITIVDPARRTAVLSMKVLNDNKKVRRNKKRPGEREFYVSGDPEIFEKTMKLVNGGKAMGPVTRLKIKS